MDGGGDRTAATTQRSAILVLQSELPTLGQRMPEPLDALRRGHQLILQRTIVILVAWRGWYLTRGSTPLCPYRPVSGAEVPCLLVVHYCIGMERPLRGTVVAYLLLKMGELLLRR